MKFRELHCALVITRLSNRAGQHVTNGLLRA